jgi:hypothetical protein
MNSKNLGSTALAAAAIGTAVALGVSGCGSPLRVDSAGNVVEISEDYNLVVHARAEPEGMTFYVLEPDSGPPGEMPYIGYPVDEARQREARRRWAERDRYWDGFRVFVHEKGRLEEAKIAWKQGIYSEKGARIAPNFKGVANPGGEGLWVRFKYKENNYQIHSSYMSTPPEEHDPVLVYLSREFPIQPNYLGEKTLTDLLD